MRNTRYPEKNIIIAHKVMRYIINHAQSAHQIKRPMELEELMNK